MAIYQASSLVLGRGAHASGDPGGGNHERSGRSSIFIKRGRPGCHTERCITAWCMAASTHGQRRGSEFDIPEWILDRQNGEQQNCWNDLYEGHLSHHARTNTPSAPKRSTNQGDSIVSGGKVQGEDPRWVIRPPGVLVSRSTRGSLLGPAPVCPCIQ